MYNDVFIKIFVALFGCKPEVPDNFRAARLLYARLRSMTTRIGDGEFDAMVSRLRIEIRLAWATVAEMYEEVASGGALEGDMVIQRLHPKPEQCFLKYDHTVPYREQELTIWSAELRALIEAMHAALAKFEPYASGGDHREFPELFRSAWGDLLRSFGLNPTPRYSPKPVYPKIITRKLHGRALLLTRDVLWWHNAPHEAERRLRDFRNPYALANKLFREEGKRRAKAKAKAEARAAAERRGEVYTSHSSSEDEGGSVPTFAEAMGVRAVCVPLLVSVCASLKPCAVAALPCELFRGPSAHKPEEFQRPRVRGAIRPGAWHVTLSRACVAPSLHYPMGMQKPPDDRAQLLRWITLNVFVCHHVRTRKPQYHTTAVGAARNTERLRAQPGRRRPKEKGTPSRACRSLGFAAPWEASRASCVLLQLDSPRHTRAWRFCITILPPSSGLVRPFSLLALRRCRVSCTCACCADFGSCVRLKRAWLCDSRGTPFVGRLYNGPLRPTLAGAIDVDPACNGRFAETEGGAGESDQASDAASDAASDSPGEGAGALSPESSAPSSRAASPSAAGSAGADAGGAYVGS